MKNPENLITRKNIIGRTEKIKEKFRKQKRDNISKDIENRNLRFRARKNGEEVDGYDNLIFIFKRQINRQGIGIFKQI